MEFDDVVFVGKVGKLSDELSAYADENDEHDLFGVDPVCYCRFCQVLIPMALKMERFIAEAEKVSTNG